MSKVPQVRRLVGSDREELSNNKGGHMMVTKKARVHEVKRVKRPGKVGHVEMMWVKGKMGPQLKNWGTR